MKTNESTNGVGSAEEQNEQLRPTAVTGSPKFIPILFSTPMVQAILEGRKTQTRRVVKDKFLVTGHPKFSTRNADVTGTCPYGQPGDILWVRETWQQEAEFFEASIHSASWDNDWWESTGAYVYRADGTELPEESEAFGKWKPSLFMPKEACRIFLKVKSVRVERLQDISETDAIAEGIEREPGLPFVVRWKDYLNTDEELEFPESSFSTLWKSINGSESWDANPWVWVIEFERIERPSGFQ